MKHPFSSPALALVAVALAPLAAGCGDPGNECAGPRDLAMLGGSSPVTLTAACSPYDLSADTTFTGVLTLEAGVAVDFAAGTSLHIEGPGGIVAQGTAQAPVVLRAKGATPWRAITTANSGSDARPARLELHHVRISGGGDHGEGLVQHSADTALLLDDVTLSQSRGHGLEVFGPLAPASSGVRVESPALAAVHLRQERLVELPTITVDATGMTREILVDSGAIAASGTVQPQPVPIHVQGSLNVTNATTTVAGPNRVLLAPDESVSVGGTGANSAGIVVQAGVTFDCAGASCTWRGVSFHNHVSASSMTGTVIARAVDGNLEESSVTPSVFYGAPINMTDDSEAMRFSFPTLTGIQFTNVPAPSGANHRVVAVTCSTNAMPPGAYSSLPMGAYWYHHP